LSASCGGHLDELDLQAVGADRRHPCVVRVDVAGVIEFDAGDLHSVVHHLHEPRVVDVVPDFVPLPLVLVCDRPIERRHPRVLIRGAAMVVDEVQGHEPSL
jgi:hypothetical protein